MKKKLRPFSYSHIIFWIIYGSFSGIYLLLVAHLGSLLYAALTGDYIDGICLKCIPETFAQKTWLALLIVILISGFAYASYRFFKRQKYALYLFLLPLIFAFFLMSL